MKQPDENSSALPLAQIQLLKVTDIIPDPKNRKDHDKHELRVLADSIERDGLLQPIVVRQVSAGKCMIVAGERRWEAHRMLKRSEIPAQILTMRAEAMSQGVDAVNQERVRKRVAENFHRVDLSPIERAQVLQEMFEAKMSHQEIADFVGLKDKSTVSNFCRLLRLPPDVQKLIHTGELSRAHGVALLRWDRWPKVVSFIAQVALKNEAKSKDLERDILPFEYYLERAGLVVKISTATWYGRSYTIPSELVKDPDFVAQKDCYYCFAPEKWAPEQKRQDAEREKKERAADKREAGRQSTMTPLQKAARKKKIADNKANRTACEDTLKKVADKLRASRGISVPALQAVIDLVLQNDRFGEHVKEAAKLLGVALPSAKGNGRSYMREFCFRHVQALKPDNAVKVAALAIVLRQSAEALRYSAPPPDSAVLIAGVAKKGRK